MKIEEEIKQTSPFKTEQHKLIINLMFTGKWVSDRIYQDLKAFGLTSQQFNVLRILRGQNKKAVSVNLIAERMIDRMSNVSRLVDKLKAKGLVSRLPSKMDKRQVDIQISNKGLKLLSEIDNSDLNMNNGFDSLSDEEAKALNELLDKVRG